MEKLYVDHFMEWVSLARNHWLTHRKCDSSDGLEFTLEELKQLSEHYDVMLVTRDGKQHMYLDTKGGQFRQR